jgi:hypothetical protein
LNTRVYTLLVYNKIILGVTFFAIVLGVVSQYNNVAEYDINSTKIFYTVLVFTTSDDPLTFRCFAEGARVHWSGSGAAGQDVIGQKGRKLQSAFWFIASCYSLHME